MSDVHVTIGDPDPHTLALSSNAMANRIKSSGEGFALQVTKPARSAGLVEEDNEGNAPYLADIRVFAFSDLLLVIDIEAVSIDDMAELVVATAQDTNSIFRAMDATVQIAGHGYQIHTARGPPNGDAVCRRTPRGRR